eukprot:TRINITY_DN9824_c0_g1_i2.p2 TRINITY_DN9824_c0_g1~~TRINITY_DN9824_c0_g1_i2.p2  ORF type:complete len:122 (+),score=11.36 TRINITY_DN9824_c0_g1_i2:463-828(+)
MSDAVLRWTADSGHVAVRQQLLASDRNKSQAPTQAGDDRCVRARAASCLLRMVLVECSDSGCAAQSSVHSAASNTLYACFAWLFFRDRIPDEEELLCSADFFGQEYEKYRRRVRTGIPFIR